VAKLTIDADGLLKELVPAVFAELAACRALAVAFLTDDLGGCSLAAAGGAGPGPGHIGNAVHAIIHRFLQLLFLFPFSGNGSAGDALHGFP